MYLELTSRSKGADYSRPPDPFEWCQDIAEMMIQLTDDKSKPVPQKPAKPQTKEQGTRVQTARPTQPQGNVPNPPSADDPRFDAKMDLEDKEETDAWLNDLNLPHAEAAILKDRTLRLLERARAKILAIVHEKRLDSADNKSRSKLSISGCVSKASRCKTFEVVMTMQCCGRVRVAFNTPCRLAGRASIFHIWKSLLKDPVLGGYLRVTPQALARLRNHGLDPSPYLKN